MTSGYRNIPWELIRTSAANHKLDPHVVAAMVVQETGSKPFKNRYEDHTDKYLVRPAEYAKRLLITEKTEIVNQMCSWGLMQIMGFRAREIGYAEDLPMLCLPHVGLEWGCRNLRILLDRYKGVYKHAIIAYNAGSVRLNSQTGRLHSENYYDEVIARVEEFGGPAPA